jgi:hypothetical protein
MLSQGIGKSMNGKYRSRSLCSALAGLLLLSSSGVTPAASPVSRVRTAPVASARVGAPMDAVAVDLTGDRRHDIAEVYADGGIGLRRGIAPGEFEPEPTLVPGSEAIHASRMFAEDVTADGNDDLVAFTPGGTQLWVFPSDGHGGFGALRSNSLPSGINGISFGDFDHDGGTDVAVASSRMPTIELLLLRSDRGGFDRDAVKLSSRPLSVATIRLTDDGRPSLVAGTSSNDVVTIRNVEGTLAVRGTKRLDFTPAMVAIGDVSEDGYQDAIFASRGGEIATLARTATGLAEPTYSGGVSRLDSSTATRSATLSDSAPA